MICVWKLFHCNMVFQLSIMYGFGFFEIRSALYVWLLQDKHMYKKPEAKEKKTQDKTWYTPITSLRFGFRCWRQVHRVFCRTEHYKEVQWKGKEWIQRLSLLTCCKPYQLFDNSHNLRLSIRLIYLNDIIRIHFLFDTAT